MEIYAQGTADDSEPFGYQERWAEMRYHASSVTGLMRPGVSGSLAIWNLAQQFTSLPELNEDFIAENPPVDRVITAPSEPHFLFDAWFDFTAVRPLPVFSTPGLLRL